ncbi:hypothetical protein LguiA_030514 [Lonicera macranthoides]
MSIRAAFWLTKFPQFQFLHQGTFLYNFAAPSLLCNYYHNVATVTTALSSIVNPKLSISTTPSQPRPPKSAYNNLDDALVSFNRMLKSRSIPSIYSINKLLGSIVKLGHYQTVLSLIKQLHLQGVLVDAYTINIGINCYCHLNRVDFGFSLLGSLFKGGYEPNVVTFTALIKGLFAQDKFSEAKNLLVKLVTDKQIELDAVTYGTVINGLCKSGNTKIAMELLRSIETLNFEADKMLCCYNMIIDSLCKDRMISNAKNLLVEMTKKGISPSVITYTSLIHGLCNFGQWKEVTELLWEMVDRNVSPNAHTFSIVVDALCKEGRVREAEDVLDVMIHRGEVPEIVTYNALMDGYCLQGQMEEAQKVFDSMVNGGLEPNIISYNTLINGYCKKRRIDEALHLFKDVSRKRLNYNIVTYNSILHGLFENGKFDVAQEVFNEMLAEGRSPDAVTYNIVLNCMCKNRQFTEAFSFFRSMQNSELYINIASYNILIDAACKDGKLEIAKELLNELLSNGLQPDARTYNAIINGLCEEGSLNEAKELLMRMEDNDCLPTDVTYNVIVRGFLKKNQTYEAMALLDKMRRSGFSADNSTIEMLVNHELRLGLSKKGADQKASNADKSSSVSEASSSAKGKLPGDKEGGSMQITNLAESVKVSGQTNGPRAIDIACYDYPNYDKDFKDEEEPMKDIHRVSQLQGSTL